MKIGTHNGRFHSDEVFAVALLKSLNPEAEVIRSRDLKVLEGCDIVVDVGGEYSPALRRFDHHQQGGAGTRANGVPYSAFGLVWKEFGLDYCQGNETAWLRLDKGFVSSFDAYDNGFKTYQMTVADARVVELQDVFDNYLNPNLDESAELANFDKQFSEALKLATQILERVTKRKIAEVASEQYFYEAWQSSPDKRFVVLEKFATSGERAEDMPELLYTVFCAPNGTWNIRAVPKEKGSYETKKPLPKQWEGLRDEEFEAVSGVKGAAFCHNNLHLCGAYTKEAALELLKMALDS